MELQLIAKIENLLIYKIKVVKKITAWLYRDGTCIVTMILTFFPIAVLCFVFSEILTKKVRGIDRKDVPTKCFCVSHKKNK